MDPDANLEAQRRLAQRLANPCDGDEPDADDVRYLAELVVALDEWIAKGGFLPSRWAQPRHP